MSEIVWKDPPPSQIGGYRPHSSPSKWERILTPLLEQPKRWAEVAHFDNPLQATWTAANLNRAARRGPGRIPPGRWEFTSRRLNGTGSVFARYLGPEDA